MLIHQELKKQLACNGYKSACPKCGQHSHEATDFFNELNAVIEISKLGWPLANKYLVDLKCFLLGITEMESVQKQDRTLQEIDILLPICNMAWPRIYAHLVGLRDYLSFLKNQKATFGDKEKKHA